MMSNDVITKLDELAELQAQADLVRLDKQAVIDGILTPEIKAQIADVEAEFAGKAAAVVEKAAALEAEIKAAVVERGETVKGARLQAVYSLRTSWDTRALEGYAAAHEEILRFRKRSESVSLRVVK